ncbi:MAG TPA: hypothetical protein PLL20_17445 [Phycisphaerae bacterium]|nr:hypothetical protein [Phycisphaerae bacterium]HRR86859.1 hypothetical protein [Phycisphaerae bacterium]
MTKETTAPTARAGTALLAAVFLLSACGLMFEITLTRFFSATIWYHFTFVAISVALFGWGLGGLFIFLLRLSRFEQHVRSILVGLSLLLAVTLPLFLAGVLQLPFSPDRLNTYFLLSLMPFLAGGAVLSLMFESWGKDSNRLYFADLIGASLGTLLVPLAIGRLGAESAILVIAVLPSLAAVLLSLSLPAPSKAKWLPASVAVLAACIGLTVWNVRTGTMTVRDAPEKELYKLLAKHPGQARIDFDKWNAFSRITSVEGFSEDYVRRIFIDSSAETSVMHWDGTPNTPPDARNWFRAFPFRMMKNPEVLVIGPGGGTDVVLSIAAGASHVTAVEMNDLIVECVRGLGAQAGNLYDHPKVELVMDEGRNYIQRCGRKFDMIVLGWVDSWASVAGGGLALTENYLYTREALEAYYDRLSDNGALVIIRWPVDVPRLVANTVSFMSNRGMNMEEISRHIVAVSMRKPGVGEESAVETVFMMSRSPLTEQQVDALLAGHDDAHLWHAPFRQCDPPYSDLFSGNISFAQYTDAFPILATPVTDDHPFYFAWDKPRGIPDFVKRLLQVPMAGVVGFTLLLLIATRYAGLRAPGPRTVAYFGALGVGFIVVEVALIQRLILLLGHPIYTLVVILFTLLLAGGCGSFFARRFAPQGIRSALGKIIPLVVLLVILAAFVLPVLVDKALPLSLPLRIMITVLMVIPYGFLMGMPFPLGLRKQSQDPAGSPASVLWGINGVASVIGSIGGVALAVAVGFTWVFLAGAVCYTVAWATRP